MAYSLPSFSAAANYAASYRPIFDGKTLADGYEGIKSEAGVAAMQNAINADFLAKVGMAKNALQEYGALERNKAAMERLEFAAKAKNKTEKKAALISLLGGGLGDVVGKRLGGGDLLSILAGTNQMSDSEIARDRIRSGNLGLDLRGTLSDGIKNLATDTGMTVDPAKVLPRQQLQSPSKIQVKQSPIKQLSLIDLLRKKTNSVK